MLPTALSCLSVAYMSPRGTIAPYSASYALFLAQSILTPLLRTTHRSPPPPRPPGAPPAVRYARNRRAVAHAAAPSGSGMMSPAGFIARRPFSVPAARLSGTALRAAPRRSPPHNPAPAAPPRPLLGPVGPSARRSSPVGAARRGPCPSRVAGSVLVLKVVVWFGVRLVPLALSLVVAPGRVARRRPSARPADYASFAALSRLCLLPRWRRSPRSAPYWFPRRPAPFCRAPLWPGRRWPSLSPLVCRVRPGPVKNLLDFPSPFCYPFCVF